MNKYFKSFLIFLLLLLPASLLYADTMNLTTYYPAPFGSYSQLYLLPTATASAPSCSIAADKGRIYYDSTEGQIKVCNGTSWGTSSPWTQNSTTKTVYATDAVTDAAYKVGIGVIPTANSMKLHLAQDGGILATGTFGSGAAVGAPGAGTRFLWYPAKAAIRAGTVSGTQWDDAFIGTYSVAFGSDNLAGGRWDGVLSGFNNVVDPVGNFVNSSVIAGGTNNLINSNLAVGGNSGAFIGGGTGNSIAPGTINTSIVGGDSNTINASPLGRSFIGGGTSNSISAPYSIVGGGKNNTTGGSNSFIGGGTTNLIGGAGSDVTIAGGNSNQADSNGTFIGGGNSNRAVAFPYATISGGQTNTTNATFATIGGGLGNMASGGYSFVGGGGGAFGGGGNTAGTGINATVVGGAGNIASGIGSFIGAGFGNKVYANDGLVVGGQGNIAGVAGNALLGTFSTVGGGQANTASGNFSTVSGGSTNTVSGDYSFAAGRNHNVQGTYSVGMGNGATTTTNNNFVYTPTAATVSTANVASFYPNNDGAVLVGTNANAPGYKLYVNGPIGGNLERANPASVGELQVDCTTTAGKCYAVYAP